MTCSVTLHIIRFSVFIFWFEVLLHDSEHLFSATSSQVGTEQACVPTSHSLLFFRLDSTICLLTMLKGNGRASA
jgi:hypothetical protein